MSQPQPKISKFARRSSPPTEIYQPASNTAYEVQLTELRNQGQYYKAIELVDSEARRRHQTLGPDHEETCDAMYDLVELNIDLRFIKEAESLFDTLANYHEQTRYARRSEWIMVDISQHQGKFSEVLEWLDEMEAENRLDLSRVGGIDSARSCIL
jgi:hypothetical protein